MPRPEKVAAVDEIRKRFEDSEGAILTEYRGLAVRDMRTLRRDLNAAGADFKVIKNTLARLATSDLDTDDISDLFVGPVAVAFYKGDPVPPAKVLRDFAKENESLVIKGSLLEGKLLDAAATRKLADLESREVLLSRLAGAMQAPIAKVAGVTSAVIRKFGYALGAYAEQRGADIPVEADTPEADADAPAAPPEGD